MPKTGRLEVAEAIEAVSGQVHITLLGNDDFIGVPPNLFDLTFNDPLVGLDDSRMSDFKTALKGFLQGEGIDDTIDRIPERANANIEDVAEVVRLALVLEAAHKDI
jgi:hypothetical protein